MVRLKIIKDLNRVAKKWYLSWTPAGWGVSHVRTEKEQPGRGNKCKGRVVASSLAALPLQGQGATSSGRRTRMRLEGWQGHFMHDLTGPGISANTIETPLQESAIPWFMVEKKNKVEAGRPVKRPLSNEWVPGIKSWARVRGLASQILTQPDSYWGLIPGWSRCPECPARDKESPPKLPLLPVRGDYPINYNCEEEYKVVSDTWLKVSVAMNSASRKGGVMD